LFATLTPHDIRKAGKHAYFKGEERSSLGATASANAPTT
jgi:hypothetical protein